MPIVQLAPSRLAGAASATLHTCMPSNGVTKRHPPAVQIANAPSCPAQAPAAPVPTIQHWPDEGEAGTAAGATATTTGCTVASSNANAFRATTGASPSSRPATAHPISPRPARARPDRLPQPARSRHSRPPAAPPAAPPDCQYSHRAPAAHRRAATRRAYPPPPTSKIHAKAPDAKPRARPISSQKIS